MKKAKIMLTAIAVFAVVGGALAFKAKRDLANVFCKTTTLPSALCVKTTYQTALIQGAPSTTLPCTNPAGITSRYYTTTACTINPVTFTGRVYQQPVI